MTLHVRDCQPGYRERRIGGVQARLIDAAWLHTAGAAPRPHRLPPHWEASLGFSRLRAPDGTVEDVRLLVFGPVETPRVYAPPPRTELIAVRIQPEAAAALLASHPREHVDVKSPLAACRDLDGARRLAETGAPAGVVTDALLDALRRRSGAAGDLSGPVSHAARLIRHSAGRVRMDTLADHLDIPERTLRRKFADRLGLSPKVYAGTIRLNALIQAADREPRPDWAGLAARFGYFDQAHMSGEVARLTGLSPARLHAERTGLAEISKTAGPRAA